VITRFRVRRLLLGLALVMILGVGTVFARSVGDEPAGAFVADNLQVEGTAEDGGGTVTLDATIYLPERVPAPAVLLAHGFGGSRQSVAADAEDLAGRGYVVLTYSARGFGNSGGLIHLDHPDFEVKDGQRMLDLLAARSEVTQESDGDPLVAVVGASYGGALALLLAGVDDRVDAIVAMYTWSDLPGSLFGQSGTRRAADSDAIGVFKRRWTAWLLASTLVGAQSAADTVPTSQLLRGPARGDVEQALCGKLAVELCRGYVRTATTGQASSGLVELLDQSSPDRVTDRITAPTLLVQGQQDSLFPLAEASANAQAVAQAGGVAKLYWAAGGHDIGVSTEESRPIVAEFLAATVGTATTAPSAGALAAVPGLRTEVSGTNAAATDPGLRTRSARMAPGVPVRDDTGQVLRSEAPLVRLPLTGEAQMILAPPGGSPAAISSLPGVGALLGALGTLTSAGAQLGGGSGLNGSAALAALPGETAAFQTEPLAEPMTMTGASQVTVSVTASTDEAILFAAVLDVDPDGSVTLPAQLVSPVRLSGLNPGEAAEVTISLPAVVRDIPAGHRLRLSLSTTDQAYAMPQDARVYRIELAGDRSLSVPQIRLSTPASSTSVPWFAVIALLLAAALLGVVFAVRAVRARPGAPDPALADVPIAIEGLGKSYKDGFRAVEGLSLRVERGQVVGLLGPNGAGKTTTLRMLMGLIMPSEGRIRIFGHEVRPGAPVLSRLGSFVEGPGFLPHLSGRDNLQLYWRAAGRTGPAHLELALAVAGLGPDVERAVRTYSQGMRQRLAIAQAMLGMPDLLVLDEPANGLDPPQIRQMREMLGRYAATGRTVVVSSHLLAEVEQTCSHLVVMTGGRLVAHGPVAEVIGDAGPILIEVDDMGRAREVAGSVEGVKDIAEAEGCLVVRASVQARTELVRSLVLAGVQVSRVAPGRGLEETFLTLVGEER